MSKNNMSDLMHYSPRIMMIVIYCVIINNEILATVDSKHTAISFKFFQMKRIICF